MLPAGLTDFACAPAWATRFRSDSVDRVRAFTSAADGPHTRAAGHNRPFNFDFFRLSGGRTVLSASSVTGTMTVRGQVPSPTLHLRVPGGSGYRVGRRAFEGGGPGTLTTVPPLQEFTRRSPSGHGLALELDERALREEIGARRPEHRASWQPHFACIALSPHDWSAWGEGLLAFVRATRPGAAPSHLVHAEAQLVALASALFLRDAVAKKPGELATRRLAELEDWITSHLSEPLTLGRLSSVAGVSARCLQKGFAARRGVSPMRFVTERRVALAYERLSGPAERDSVASVATELGFTHLGRFARTYRELVGESPLQTVAAARR